MGLFDNPYRSLDAAREKQDQYAPFRLSPCLPILDHLNSQLLCYEKG